MAKLRKPLPDGISLDTVKEEVRSLQKAGASGDADAHKRVRPYVDDLFGGPAAVSATLKLRQAQLVVAREYGFSNWRKLKAFLDAREAVEAAMHNVAGIRDRMPRPSRGLLDEMKAAQQELARIRKRHVAASPQPVPETETNTLHCSFCRKSQHEVSKLIAGSGVFICDECVSTCNEILFDEAQDTAGTR